MVSTKLSLDTLSELLTQRWQESLLVYPDLATICVYWEIGDSPHFRQARGFATTKTDGTTFWLTFRDTFMCQPSARQDAILRHEIGHIVDFSGVHPREAAWGPEGWADEIAARIWQMPIRYDVDDVQTLLAGTSPRPERLGR